MANKKLITRVGALGLMGGAGVLFAAQAGVLPGVGSGMTTASNAAPQIMSVVPAAPTAQTPAALSSVLNTAEPTAETFMDPDLAEVDFAQVLAPDIPDSSAFGSAPDIVIAAPAIATPQMADAIRPAALSTTADLPTPDAPVTEKPVGAAELSPFGLPCGLNVTADPVDNAMIALGIAAPCHPDAVVTITHSGLSVSERLDAFGLLTLDLPALETPAFITVALPDGEESDQLLPIPELADFDRVAITWRGDLGIELHVMEDGATWMSEGHVHASAPSGLGMLTVLGNDTLDAPMMAQVYTMPRDGGPTTATLSVDAPVTLSNCTQTVEARILHVGDTSSAEMMPLGFTYPTCDAVGDTLVLQNAFGDLRLAAN